MSTTVLTKENFEQEVMNSKETVLIDFWASWCGPCQALSPIIDEISQEVDSNVKVCKVNVDEESELASEFEVMSIPTLIVMKNGQTVNRSTGIKQKDEILSML